MSPARMAGPAYWASGGDVIGRSGAMSTHRAFDLLRVFANEAEFQWQAGDLAAGQLLSSLALELGAAIAGAAAWRRAATGPTSSSLRA